MDVGAGAGAGVGIGFDTVGVGIGTTAERVAIVGGVMGGVMGGRGSDIDVGSDTVGAEEVVDVEANATVVEGDAGSAWSSAPGPRPRRRVTSANIALAPLPERNARFTRASRKDREMCNPGSASNNPSSNSESKDSLTSGSANAAAAGNPLGSSRCATGTDVARPSTSTGKGSERTEARMAATNGRPQSGE